MNFSLPHL